MDRNIKFGIAPVAINLFAGPGSGKSTTAAAVFAQLKLAQINCEMAREFAKEKVWERSYPVLEDQLYVFAKQAHRMKILEDQVDVIITDSPLYLSLVYGDTSTTFGNLVKEIHFNSYINFNYFIQRTKPFHQSGRIQTETEATDLDRGIKLMLDEFKEPYTILDGDSHAATAIFHEYVTWRMKWDPDFKMDI
tara:strand:- start:1413 stop:1988 length:576 start_codon:yes stop_codon:yes gene_type:complete